MIIAIVVLCVVIFGVVAGVLFVRSRPAAQLRSARGRPAAARRVAAASAALTAAGTAADRFGLITTELLAFPAPSSAPACADEQLTDVADALARLEHAADQVAQAGAALAGLAAAGQGSGQGTADTSRAKLAAVLAEVAKLPTDRTTPDKLAAAVTRHTALVSVAAAAAGKPGPVTRIEAALPADPHVAARAELLSGLEALGLDGAWTDLRTWPEFARQRDGYDARQLGHARDFARQVEATRAREAAAMADIPRLAGPRRIAGPPDQGDQLDAGARQLAGELCGATAAYAEQARALLGPGAERVPWLAAVPGLLSGCERQLRDRDLAGALAALAGAPLPVIASWRPSQDYDAAWRRAADGLAEFAGQYQEVAARRAADTAARFGAAVTRLGEAADAGLTAWQTARDASWDGLQDVAAEVKQNAAAVLAAPGTSRDAAEPVRAAAAVLITDQIAAANAAQLVRRAFPDPDLVASEGAGADERLEAFKSLCLRLDKHAELLSGLDGVLMSALTAEFPVSGTGLDAALTALTPVPADLIAGYKDALAFSHHMLAGLTWDGVGKAFVHQVSQSLLPSVGHDGLLLSMLEADNPVVTALGSTAGSAASALAKQIAAHNPAVLDASQHLGDAAHHVTHAAGLAAPDALHAVLGHIPVITLTLSSIREIRLLNEGVTTMGTSVRNITLDAAGVGLGFLAGEAAAHALLHTATAGASLLFAVPLSAAGRKLFKSIKERPYLHALERFEEVQDSYAVKSLDTASRLESAARTAHVRHRAEYLGALTAPPGTKHSAAEVARLTAELRTATAAYLRTVSDVLAVGWRLGMPASSESGTTFIQALPRSMVDCDAQLASGDNAAALLTLTASPLPAPATWRPAADYRQLCAATAARIAELTDADRTRMARWATGSARLFQTHAKQVAVLAREEAQAAEQELAAASTAVREAEAIVTAEAAKLGKKK